MGNSDFAPAEDTALRGRNRSAVWSLQTAERPGGFGYRAARPMLFPTPLLAQLQCDKSQGAWGTASPSAVDSTPSVLLSLSYPKQTSLI